MISNFRLISTSVLGLFLIVVGLIIFAPAVHAGGAVGGGGNPTGGSGSYYTSNGYGWYSYNANSGSGPEAWSSGGPWSTVRKTCTDAGASRVIAFIIQRSGGNNTGNNAKVYQWNTNIFKPGWSGWKSDSGGNWIPVKTAKSLFNQLDSSTRSGFTFGKNVAWFCYQQINYDLIPSLTSDHVGAESEEPVNVTPAVTNVGPTNSKANTYWVITSMAYTEPRTPPTVVGVTNNSGQASVNKTTNNNGKPCEYYTSTGASNCAAESSGWGTGTFPVGSTPAVSFVRASGNTWGSKRFIISTGFAIGTKACYGLSLYSKNQTSDAWAHSVPTCIIIGKRPKVQIHGGDLIVGRSFVGGAAATGNSTVETSQTVKYR